MSDRRILLIPAALGATAVILLVIGLAMANN
jgi:hypothetical protein